MSDNEKCADKIFFEQYKLCVQSAEAVNARKQSVNYLYLIVVAALAIIYKSLPDMLPSTFLRSGYYVIILLIMGATALWMWSLDYLFSLRDAKRKIIIEMEKKLPAQPFTQEWKEFEDVEEKRENSHRVIETWLPKIIFLVCGYFMFGVVVKKIFWPY